MFTAGIGTPRIASSNLNLNLRQGKLNFYLSGGFNQSGGKARSETHRINRQNGQTSNYFDQFSYNDRRRLFANIRFGADYFIDNRNTISLTQQFGRGRFSYKEDQDQQYLNASKELQYYGERLGDGKSVFKRGGTTLNYKHSLPARARSLQPILLITMAAVRRILLSSIHSLIPMAAYISLPHWCKTMVMAAMTR